MSKLYSLIINIQIFLNIIWKGKGKRVNNGYHCYHRTVRFFWVFLLKNRPEPNKTGSVWTGSRFGPGCINKKSYFPVWLYFLVKTGPDRTVNTPTTYPLNWLARMSLWAFFAHSVYDLHAILFALFHTIWIILIIVCFSTLLFYLCVCVCVVISESLERFLDVVAAFIILFMVMYVLFQC
jgi:hypothetical protein